jgi:hypothetical protein
MYSRLKPTFLYTDVSPDITETDVDVVSDLWSMDGRDVYRGARDPRYTHANVYWLYDEDLQRVGCSEHSLDDHGDFRLLWFHESVFGTLLQEDGWTIQGDVWSRLPRQPFERFINEGWTTADNILEQCLYGPLRIVTPEMLVTPRKMYVCGHCGKKSLRNSVYCMMTQTDLDFPQLEKVLFVDADFFVHVPPPESSVFTRLLRLPCDDSQPPSGQTQQPEPVLEPEQVQVQEAQQGAPPPQQQEQPSPPQSRPRTPEPPSDAGEEQPSHE